MTNGAGPVETRPGGSLAAGVVLGVVLGLLAPLALMSLHIGGLFGGFSSLRPVVLAELIVGILVWLVVGVVLLARRSRRRKGIGVLIGGAVPALMLLTMFLPVLLPGALSQTAATQRDCTSDEEAVIRELVSPDGQITEMFGADACYATVTTAVASADWRAYYERRFAEHGWQKVTVGEGRDTDVLSAVRAGFLIEVRPWQSQDVEPATRLILRPR